MVELISSGDRWSDKKHVRNLNNIDFVDIGSFEELY
jgi:hypothetical protein